MTNKTQTETPVVVVPTQETRTQKLVKKFAPGIIATVGLAATIVGVKYLVDHASDSVEIPQVDIPQI
jgi:hypothetical protein